MTGCTSNVGHHLSMTESPVQISYEDRVATITLDHPAKRNALSVAMMRALTSAFEQVGASDAVGVILAAEGPVFSAGHNFGDMAGADLDETRRVFRICTEMMDTIQAIPQPVVARVHALATAAGCQLVATCDLAVAAESASFAIPGGKGGLFCHTPLVAVARNVGRKRALELAMTGDPIDAGTAAEWGLVNRVVPDDELVTATAELLRRATARCIAVEGARQAGVLRADRPAAGRGLRPDGRADGRVRRRPRRAGGDRRLPRQTPPVVRLSLAARLAAMDLETPTATDAELLAALERRLAELGRVVVAFSGGADSAFLVAVAQRILGVERVHAVTAVSASLATDEAADCRALAAEWGLRWTPVATDELANAAYRINDGDRCYHCKTELMHVLGPIAERERATVVLGVNLDDLGDHRPGQRAAAERGAVFPMVDAGLDKAAIRRLSRADGLRTWDKPAAACLASRLPYGTPVTLTVLGTVDRAEGALRRLGFAALRVRDYGDTARIELPLDELGLAVARRAEIVDALHRAGYRYVTLDLEGLRSGNLNAALRTGG